MTIGKVLVDSAVKKTLVNFLRISHPLRFLQSSSFYMTTGKDSLFIEVGSNIWRDCSALGPSTTELQACESGYTSFRCLSIHFPSAFCVGMAPCRQTRKCLSQPPSKTTKKTVLIWPCARVASTLQDPEANRCRQCGCAHSPINIRTNNCPSCQHEKCKSRVMEKLTK